ncbi:DEAD/DEAH box helicase [Corynebacterium sp. ES2794-CONJ1]|uniref:DEAD/DEAH box helicase n=1 Tax=Corynebacterium sp. ES2794-CONJ1 TaxID=2980553 RepID=UPI0021D9861F|nr:DEAD/DEAH box helicase [Corynebacterium sp. ES2794-CONJ1]MCU9518325.1 DEAD/DEAH box helicase [Corynebacterium sp. ES2794-CONJ1]
MSFGSHLDVFRQSLSHPLDDFQIAGCQAIENGHGVLVCAPTGAGKTIVGEFAVSLALSQGTKCFYTTPIKALSNQKYHDLVGAHGSDNVGLLTGDTSINRDADILVMTTEVLRNMIYAQSDTLDRLSHVVMDEIHFLADRSRGAVWEEVILGLADTVKIIGLSATVSNYEEFGEWLQTVRGDTEVIISEDRPVPLDQWMLVGRKIFPLFEPNEVGTVNRRLESYIERISGDDRPHGHSDFFAQKSFRARSGGGSGRTSIDRPQAKRTDRHRPLGRPEVIQILSNHEMLPAIVFIFSRAGCDGALAQCLGSKIVLTSQEESEKIAEIVAHGVKDIPEEDLKILEFRKWKAALTRGFAAHHAGMLPAFRHIVEKLFTRGLVKAVFATETLALGINMPARSVVLEKLVKYDGEGHVDLSPGQFTQLTGRAGRRGIDTLGNAVVMWAPAMDPQHVSTLASTRTYPLISTFAPGYNMSVNLLKTIGFSPAHRLLEKSFAQFQADGSVVEEIRDIERAENRVEDLERKLQRAIATADIASEDPLANILEYFDLRSSLSRAEKAQKKRSLEERAIEVTAVLSRLQLGDVIALPGRKKPILAVVVQPAHNRHDPRPKIIMESGWAGRVDSAAFPIAPQRIGHMRLPRPVIARPEKNSRLAKELFAKNSYPRPKRMRPDMRHRPSTEILKLRAELRSHPAHYWPHIDDLNPLGQQLTRARLELKKRRNQVNQATETLGKQFDRILGLLAEMDYVEFDESGTPAITEEGERLALIHSESDLLIAQCLRRGIWDGLDPAELAGVVSMCSFENRREARGEAQGATDAMVVAMNNTMRIWEQLSFDERRHRLTQTKMPEPGFALALHQWTAGAPLGYCLAAAHESGAELTPGDFVRQARQVVDLLEQMNKTSYNEDTIHTAKQAAAAIRRGVVALGT